MALSGKLCAVPAAFTGVETAPSYRELSRETGRDDKALKKWRKLFLKYADKELYLPVAQDKASERAMSTAESG